MTPEQAKDIQNILERRAQDISSFGERMRALYKTKNIGSKEWEIFPGIELPGSVELALENEKKRLRGLADVLNEFIPNMEED